MSIPEKNPPAHSATSNFETAAWISFVIAIFLVVTIAAQLLLGLFEGETLMQIEELWFLGCITGFILGATSLFRFRRHRRKLTVWMALAGVLITGGLATAEIIFFICLLSGMGHNC